MAEQDFGWGTIGASISLVVNATMASLANGTLSGYDSEVHNSVANTDGVTYPQTGTLVLALGSAAFVAPSYIQLFMAHSSTPGAAAGTYPTLTSAAAAALSNYLRAVVYINGSNAAQNETYDNVEILAGYFKCFVLTGGSCPTLAASGNSFVIYPTPTRWQ